jgi:hypothetical protein
MAVPPCLQRRDVFDRIGNLPPSAVPRVAAGGSDVVVEEREVFSNFLKVTYTYEEQAVL